MEASRQTIRSIGWLVDVSALVDKVIQGGRWKRKGREDVMLLLTRLQKPVERRALHTDHCDN